MACCHESNFSLPVTHAPITNMCHDYILLHTSLGESVGLDTLLIQKHIQCLPQMFQVNLLHIVNRMNLKYQLMQATISFDMLLR